MKVLKALDNGLTVAYKITKLLLNSKEAGYMERLIKHLLKTYKCAGW